MTRQQLWKNILGYLKVTLPIYVFYVLVLYFLQSFLLYPGQFISTPKDGFGVFQLKTPTGILHGWVGSPEKEKAVVFFGGNGMALEPMRHYLQYCTNRAVYLVPYRGYEGQIGHPSEKVLVDDGLRVVEQAKREHSKGVAIIGVSLGSGVAMQVAHQTQVDRLVLITPYDSITSVAQSHEWFIPVKWLLHDSYDSVGIAKDIQQPVYLLRGRYDTLVYPARTDNLIAHLQHPMVEWANTTHNGVWAEPYNEQTCAFIQKALNTP